MRLKVDKLPSGKVRLEVTPDPAKAPVAVEVEAWQAETVAALLARAAKADKFTFLLEL